MKTPFTSFIACLALSFGLSLSAFAGTAPHGTSTKNTKAFQQVLNTDNLRILSLELAPGEQLEFHASPEQEAYAASAGTLTVVDSEGVQKELKVKAGDRLWSDLTYFQNVNTGANTLKIVLLERAK